jgi:uncharacterized protein
MLHHAISWFDIPATDFDRAKTFYGQILGTPLHDYPMTGMQMAVFPADRENGVGGAIVASPYHKPNADGSIVYLNGGDDLAHVLARVPAAGGMVVQPKTQISPEIGYMAFFIDTEGNRVGLCSPN